VAPPIHNIRQEVNSVGHAATVEGGQLVGVWVEELDCIHNACVPVALEGEGFRLVGNEVKLS